MEKRIRGERLHNQENNKGNQPHCELRLYLPVILRIDEKQAKQEYEVSKRYKRFDIDEQHVWSHVFERLPASMKLRAFLHAPGRLHIEITQG